ncbi:hypothetical protein EWM64_g4003 [Hericium alpestre]|uniref:Ketoreductase (KR) domain-containing protein n=1 Tax=Hericium alpestre TaxID=135208 RepID=A0A4Z0A2B9_9AGAM|nr:hypothetical protein EWM64_g4003 [Hericium alpestre]
MGLTYEEIKETNERPLPQLEDQDIAGRTVVVTGANTGIGYEVTKYMAKYNASKIILACRNKSKGQDAIARIANDTGRDVGAFECWPLDLASMASVRCFAKRYNDSGLFLHIFIHNAAMVVMGQGKLISEDGFDLTLQANYIAPTLLSVLLYPVLERTGALDKADPARFIWVISGVPSLPFNESADAHPIEAMNKQAFDLSGTKPHWPYLAAKLTCLLACHEYARRIPSSANIAVAAATPGVVASELGQKDVNGNNFQAMDIEKFTHVRPRTCEEGASAEDDRPAGDIPRRGGVEGGAAQCSPFHEHAGDGLAVFLRDGRGRDAGRFGQTPLVF